MEKLKGMTILDDGFGRVCIRQMLVLNIAGYTRVYINSHM